MDITHHFFKVYVPSHCFHNLKIPTTFVQKMNGVVVPGVSFLKDPLGRSWLVEVEKVDDAFYFQSGWRKFVEANCLNLGDFVFFRFMGNSVFNVTVFDNSGCEKDENLEVFVKEEEQEQKEEHEEQQQEQDQEQQEHEEQEQDQEQEEEHEEQEEEHEEQEQEQEQDQEQEEEHEEEVHEEQQEDGFSGATADFDEPMNPYFIASVKENRPYHLHIPKAVVDQNNISLKPRMILLDPNQKKWPVRLCFRKDGRIIFSKGWWDFWTGNFVTPHDKCIFEFEQDEESNVIKVNIIRATRQVN